MRVFQSFSFFLLFVALLTLPAVAQSTGGVKGKVRTTKGDGISGASVTARQKGEDVKTVRSDGKGEFVLDGLEPGLYNLVFEKNGYSSGVLYNIEIKKKKVSSLSERLVLTVDQGTQVIIKGSVFNRNGYSIPNVKIEIEKISADGSARKIDTQNASQSGEFTFRFPEEAAKFRVTASHDGETASREIEVDGAAIYRLAITLDLKKRQ